MEKTDLMFLMQLGLFTKYLVLVPYLPDFSEQAETAFALLVVIGVGAALYRARKTTPQE